MGIMSLKLIINSCHALPLNKLFIVWCKLKETVVMFTTIQCQRLLFSTQTMARSEIKGWSLMKGNNFILVWLLSTITNQNNLRLNSRCMDPVSLSNQSASNTFSTFKHKCSFFQNSCDSTCNATNQNLSSYRRRSYTSPERSETPVKELVNIIIFIFIHI